MTGKILKLCDKDGDTKRSSPSDALKMVLDCYEKGRVKGTKIVIICLDDTGDNEYMIYCTTAGVRDGSEARSMLQAAGYLYLKDTFED